MTEKRITVEEISKRAVYTLAGVVPGEVQPAPASDALQQRTVVTSLTEGTVVLRYAPRTPKAAEPVDTAS
jgi:hypothetical protein